MSHTPGPWTAEPTNPNDGWDGWEVFDANGVRLADSYGSQSNSTREANARLIAAAPDLLDALRLIEHATAPTHEDGAYHENAYDIARAAIAKATQ